MFIEINWEVPSPVGDYLSLKLKFQTTSSVYNYTFKLRRHFTIWINFSFKPNFGLKHYLSLKLKCKTTVSQCVVMCREQCYTLLK